MLDWRCCGLYIRSPLVTFVRHLMLLYETRYAWSLPLTPQQELDMLQCYLSMCFPRVILYWRIPTARMTRRLLYFATNRKSLIWKKDLVSYLHLLEKSIIMYFLLFTAILLIFNLPNLNCLDFLILENTKQMISFCKLTF